MIALFKTVIEYFSFYYYIFFDNYSSQMCHLFVCCRDECNTIYVGPAMLVYTLSLWQEMEGGVLQRVLRDLLPVDAASRRKCVPMRHSLRSSSASTTLSDLGTDAPTKWVKRGTSWTKEIPSNQAKTAVPLLRDKENCDTGILKDNSIHVELGNVIPSVDTTSDLNNSCNVFCNNIEAADTNNCDTLPALVEDDGIGGVTDDKVVLTFLEVYNEKAYDLLAPTRTQLATRSDAGGGCRVLFVS